MYAKMAHDVVHGHDGMKLKTLTAEEKEYHMTKEQVLESLTNKKKTALFLLKHRMLGKFQKAFYHKILYSPVDFAFDLFVLWDYTKSLKLIRCFYKTSEDVITPGKLSNLGITVYDRNGTNHINLEQVHWLITEICSKSANLAYNLISTFLKKFYPVINSFHGRSDRGNGFQGYENCFAMGVTIFEEFPSLQYLSLDWSQEGEGKDDIDSNSNKHSSVLAQAERLPEVKIHRGEIMVTFLNKSEQDTNATKLELGKALSHSHKYVNADTLPGSLFSTIEHPVAKPKFYPPHIVGKIKFDQKRHPLPIRAFGLMQATRPVDGIYRLTFSITCDPHFLRNHQAVLDVKPGRMPEQPWIGHGEQRTYAADSQNCELYYEDQRELTLSYGVHELRMLFFILHDSCL